MTRLILGLAVCCGVLSAQPVIFPKGIVNAGSFARPGLPGGAIARGSVFLHRVIPYGDRVGHVIACRVDNDQRSLRRVVRYVYAAAVAVDSDSVRVHDSH